MEPWMRERREEVRGSCRCRGRTTVGREYVHAAAGCCATAHSESVTACCICWTSPPTLQ
jgi:hypothetical protein